jgi:hypothetical protein
MKRRRVEGQLQAAVVQHLAVRATTAAGIDEAIEQLEQWNLLRGRRT